MPSRALKTPEHREGWIRALRAQPLPLTVSFTKGAKRTQPQNKTIHMWYGEAAAQLGENSLDVRAECKLIMGVPILRRDDGAFRQWYDVRVMRLPHPEKLDLFRWFDPAITSRMTTKQLSEYMDTMQRHFAPMGIVLRDPEARKYEGAL